MYIVLISSDFFFIPYMHTVQANDSKHNTFIHFVVNKTTIFPFCAVELENNDRVDNYYYLQGKVIKSFKTKLACAK